MKKQSPTEALNERIRLLQMKKDRELIVLKEQAHLAYESLRPINLIKNMFHEVASTPDLKNGIVSNVIGLATGFLSRKVLIGGSHNPIKRIVGALLQFGIANVVSKHADTIKAAGENIFKRILKPRNGVNHEFRENGNDAAD